MSKKTQRLGVEDFEKYSAAEADGIGGADESSMSIEDALAAKSSAFGAIEVLTLNENGYSHGK